MPRRGERKIDAFKVEVEGETIEVPVWLIKVEAGPYVERGTKFRAIHEDSRLRLENTDINELRKEIEKEIHAWYKIDWTLWILVNAGHSAAFHDFNVRFGYVFYVVGDRPDGEKVHMEVPEPKSLKRGKPWDGKWDTKTRWAGKSPRKGLPKTGPSTRDHTGQRSTTALIPATIENVEAVRHFDRMLRKLADEIVDHFEPESIEDTLIRISKVPGISMLPEVRDDCPYCGKETASCICGQYDFTEAIEDEEGRGEDK